MNGFNEICMKIHQYILFNLQNWLDYRIFIKSSKSELGKLYYYHVLNMVKGATQKHLDVVIKKLGKKDFLLNRLYEDIEILSNFFDVFIITDARLIHEFLSIKAKYDDVVSIKLVRKDFDNDLTIEEKNHITEKEINMYDDFDYIIYNKGLDSLKDEAIEIIHNTELEER